MADYLRLRDLLSDKPFDIEYRCNAPKCDDEDDMLFGYCRWDGNELISLDGDSYYLNDVIENYEWRYTDEGDYLTVWIEVVWSSDKYYD